MWPAYCRQPHWHRLPDQPKNTKWLQKCHNLGNGDTFLPYFLHQLTVYVHIKIPSLWNCYTVKDKLQTKIFDLQNMWQPLSPILNTTHIYPVYSTYLPRQMSPRGNQTSVRSSVVQLLVVSLVIFPVLYVASRILLILCNTRAFPISVLLAESVDSSV